MESTTTKSQQTETIYQTTIPPLKTKTQSKIRSLINVFHDAKGNRYGNIFTYTQILIVTIIAARLYRRIQLILPTQYGKSLSVAIGVLLRISTHKEKWAIIAPTEDKARIIMDYIIEHIFDDPALIQLLDYHGTKEQLMQERSKNRITFRGKGEVRIYTANANNMQAVEKSLTGFGAPNIIIDESSLVHNKIYAMVKRMLGGSEGTEGGTFLLEIGNPFFKNHFWRTWVGKLYHKIFVDYKTALEEGRYSKDYIDEMRDEAFFDVLYECKFPETSSAPDGYTKLVSNSIVENAFIKNDLPLGHKDNGDLYDQPILGVDPNHGGKNKTSMTIRYPLTGFAKVVLLKQYADTKDVTGEIIADIINIMEKYGIEDRRVGIDGGGVGAGVVDGMYARGYEINSILFGQKPDDPTRYANAKAEMYMRLRKWLRTENGKLVQHDGFFELNEINFKQTSTSKTIMESKEDLQKRGIASPDVADSLALTFITVSDVDDEDSIVVI